MLDKSIKQWALLFWNGLIISISISTGVTVVTRRMDLISVLYDYNSQQTVTRRRGCSIRHEF